MRKELKKIKNKRTTFIGEVNKFGTKPSYKGYPKKTILLINIKFKETNEIATDHIWFTVGKTIENIELNIGDIIQFDARVKQYKKGYIEKEVDYKLSNISKIYKKHTCHCWNIITLFDSDDQINKINCTCKIK